MTTLTRTGTASDAEVFEAFTQGRVLAGDTLWTDVTCTAGLLNGDPDDRMARVVFVVLYSHGVPVAWREDDRDTAAIDEAPAAPGCRCVCRVVTHAKRAREAARVAFGDEGVRTVSHTEFQDTVASWLP